MKNHHIAFWTKDLEKSLDFYIKHFNATEKFRHQDGDFKCIFILLGHNLYLELMTRNKLEKESDTERVGYSHFSLEVESREEVNRLTEYFKEKNVPLEKVMEQYDDGFYESSVRDPDGNIIEIAYIDRTVNPHV